MVPPGPLNRPPDTYRPPEVDRVTADDRIADATEAIQRSLANIDKTLEDQWRALGALVTAAESIAKSIERIADKLDPPPKAETRLRLGPKGEILPPDYQG